MQRFKTLKGYARVDCKGRPDLCTFTQDLTKSGNIEWTYVEVKYPICAGDTVGGAGIEMIDYNYNLTIQTIGSNTYYKTRKSFIAGSTRVYFDGVRMTPNDGSSDTYDYVEVSNTKVQFVRTIPSDTNITIEYNTL